jgi:hypothetical protein
LPDLKRRRVRDLQRRHGAALVRARCDRRGEARHRRQRANTIAPRGRRSGGALRVGDARFARSCGCRQRPALDTIVADAWRWHSTHPKGFGVSE